MNVLTNEQILKIAMEQSAKDLCCKPEDFEKTEHVFSNAEVTAGAKVYYQAPVPCNFVSYGGNVVASVCPECREIAKEYLQKFTYYHCFETPCIHWLEEKLRPLGYRVCFMAEYFLPDVTKLRRLDCKYELRVLEQKDFAALYLPEWGNALCKDRKELDVLGVGAYDGERLIALAGCSMDAKEMWQIGVDVLPEYRRQGVASAITSNLAVEILARGKVPFYCCAWSNLPSLKNALHAGFAPAWVEMSVKPSKKVEDVIHPIQAKEG